MEELTEDIKQVIQDYFWKGYKYKTIHYLLDKSHGLKISFQTLKRDIIPGLGLRRRGVANDIEDTISKAQFEIENSCTGHENLRKTFKMKYRMQVTRAFCRELVAKFDAEGVKRRKRRRLRRRQYINKGPNYVWHIDGYDKLKPFGISIHGCIDGFSRKLLWLHAGITNKRPEVVASHFVQAVEEIEGFPTKVRGDRGTENVTVADMMSTLVGDERSFIYGVSTANQRIERWWGILRQCKADFWINHFKLLVGDGHLLNGEKIDMLCIQYVYLPIIQRQLNEVKEIWNSHTIRRQRVGDVLPGIPNLLYYNPETADSETYIQPINNEGIELLKGVCEHNFFIDEDFVNVANDVLQSNGIPHPNDIIDFEAARNCYIFLHDKMNQLLK